MGGSTEVQNPGSQAFVKLVQYTIDGLGNRSQVQTTPPTPPTQVTYASDVMNQYTQVGGTSRTHDNNGNLSDDGTYKFGYEFENRRVELRSSSTSALIAAYRYDALGRRVEKALSGAATTRYVLDGLEVVEEYDGSDNWQALYVYEDGIDHPRCMDRADIADVNGNGNTIEILRFHYQQQALASVTEMTQPTGAVVEWVTYDVYGMPTLLNMNGVGISQSAIGNPHLYTGREYDPESGTFFYRARTYDPGTGRFLQRDQEGYLVSANPYEYVRSRPAQLVDPRGRKDKKPGMPAAKHAPHLELRGSKENVHNWIDLLESSGLITESEAADVRNTLRTNPGATLTRLHARSYWCKRSGKKIKALYVIEVELNIKFIIDPPSGPRPDDNVPPHEEGHADIGDDVADDTNESHAEGVPGKEVYVKLGDSKDREKEINAGNGRPITGDSGAANNGQSPVHDPTIEKVKRNNDYDGPDASGGSRYPGHPDNTPEQEKRMRELGAGRD